MNQLLKIMLVFLFIGCGSKNKDPKEYFNDKTINGEQIKGLGDYIIGVTTLNDIKKEGHPLYSYLDILHSDTQNSYRYEYVQGSMDLDTIVGVDKVEFYDNSHRLYDDTLICQLRRREYWVEGNMICNNLTLSFYKDTLVAIAFSNSFGNKDCEKAGDILEMYITKYGKGRGYHEKRYDSYFINGENHEYEENISEYNWENTSINMKLYHILTHYKKSGNLRSEMTVQIKDKKGFSLFCDRLKETYNESINNKALYEINRRKKVMDGI